MLERTKEESVLWTGGVFLRKAELVNLGPRGGSQEQKARNRVDQ